ncbi:MAG: hypothetical protein D3909_01775 [Candidatus Electrothrix sp. ATG1]|nr:hypothetical protein [Candidatus Electrothrix sp. ATG1]MCI5207507.1 hypothetical protein [Candidatus Electrothrix sp. ATG2]
MDPIVNMVYVVKQKVGNCQQYVFSCKMLFACGILRIKVFFRYGVMFYLTVKIIKQSGFD